MAITAVHAPTLRDYGRVLWRRRWIVVLVTLIAPAAAVAMAERQAPSYQASAEVLLQNSNLASSLTGVADTTLYQDPAWLDQTQADLASVPTVARRAIALAGIKGMSAADLLGESSVTPHSNSDFLDFTVSDGNPARAQKLATAYADAYTGYRSQVDTAAITRALDQANSHLARLRAQGDTRSSLYQSVASKVETLQTLAALQTSNAYVVRDAGPAAQISPRPKRDGALALALGLILGIGLAFLRETLDTRIRSADEIAAALGLPLLARVSEPPKRLASKRQLSALAEPYGPASESFRLLRTSLDFASLERETRSILVTSALQGEGKSTTASNLAVALAQAGRRVALVDLDLREPSLHEFFDLDPAVGLTTVCLGERTLDEALQPIVVSGDRRLAAPPDEGRPEWRANGGANGAARGALLEVLLTGPLPPDPGEFVGTQVVADVLAELRQRAQIVVVDAPPLLGVVDALTLSSRVDGLLLVTRLTMLRRPLLHELHRVLETVPAAKLGFVLGDAGAEERYGYGVGVQYYGYGSPAETEIQEPVG
jgi:tyrosine-protein kinase